jgi:hypothetical protein
MNIFLKTAITALAPVAGYLVAGLQNPTGGFASYLNAHPTMAIASALLGLLLHNAISAYAPHTVDVSGPSAPKE